MSSQIPNVTQECEDAAARCWHVSEVIWHGNIRPKFIAWRDYRNAHPTPPYDSTDMDLRNSFYSHMINDLNLPWLAPNQGRYFTLGGSWDGKRCLSGAATCQPTPPIGHFYYPDPGWEFGEHPINPNPIIPPYDPNDPDMQPTPSTNAQCYSDYGVVAQLSALQAQAFAANNTLVSRLCPGGTVPQDDPRYIDENALIAWATPYIAIYNMYINLWFNTFCGNATPAPIVQLSPFMPHPIPLPAPG